MKLSKTLIELNRHCEILRDRLDQATQEDLRQAAGVELDAACQMFYSQLEEFCRANDCDEDAVFDLFAEANLA